MSSLTTSNSMVMRRVDLTTTGSCLLLVCIFFLVNSFIRVEDEPTYCLMFSPALCFPMISFLYEKRTVKGCGLTR